jgi:hypothetical protein
MKKLLSLFSAVLILSSCASTKEVKSSRAEARNEKKLVKQEVIKTAVESRRFIVKLNRLYLTYGGIIQLVPRANYIIVDGSKGVISTAYFGRQFNFRPIAGINMIGRTDDYELTNNMAKGVYRVNMKVTEGANSFSVFLTISKNGSCNASISSMMINSVKYSGNVVPIKGTTTVPPPNGRDVI